MQVMPFKLIYAYDLVLFKSISKDSEEISSFIEIFIEEHGQPPAFNIFESCEQIVKRY
jgi:hypothetical protein